MKIFITGATGYIGHQIALKLATEDYKVIALVRDLKSNKIPNHKNIYPVKGDICDFDSVDNAIKGCSYVFHVAAYTNLRCKDVDDFYTTNVLGTENVLKASQKYQVNKVIFTSTLTVYGSSYKEVAITEEQPRITSYINNYELTKSMAEELVDSYAKEGLSCVILNLTRVYGPGLGTFTIGVNKLISIFLKKHFIVVPKKLDSILNYVFIDDVVNAHLLAMKSLIHYDKFIIGGENISYSKLFLVIEELAQRKIKILKFHFGSFRLYLFIRNMFYTIIRITPSITPKVLDFLFVNRISTSHKAKVKLNYKVTSLATGLQETIKYLKTAT